MNPELAAFFAPPTDTDRARIRADLIRRGRLVQEHGWADYVHVWSHGEVEGVALLLEHRDLLRDLGADTRDVLGRYAYDLHGLAGGNHDRENGWADTRAWFAAARDALHY